MPWNQHFIRGTLKALLSFIIKRTEFYCPALLLGLILSELDCSFREKSILINSFGMDFVLVWKFKSSDIWYQSKERDHIATLISYGDAIYSRKSNWCRRLIGQSISFPWNYCSCRLYEEINFAYNHWDGNTINDTMGSASSAAESIAGNPEASNINIDYGEHSFSSPSCNVWAIKSIQKFSRIAGNIARKSNCITFHHDHFRALPNI